MRYVKSPADLKKWRITKEALDAQIKIASDLHEQEMMKWAIEHAITGPTIICPDGKIRTVPMNEFDFAKVRRRANY